MEHPRPTSGGPGVGEWLPWVGSCLAGRTLLRLLGVVALVPLQVGQVWLVRTVACGLRPGHAGLEVCRAGQDYSEQVLRSQQEESCGSRGWP